MHCSIKKLKDTNTLTSTNVLNSMPSNYFHTNGQLMPTTCFISSWISFPGTKKKQVNKSTKTRTAFRGHFATISIKHLLWINFHRLEIRLTMQVKDIIFPNLQQKQNSH